MALILILWSVFSTAIAAGPGKDYLTVAESSGGSIVRNASTESLSAKASPASAVRYLAFDGRPYQMDEYPGNHVSVLLPAGASEDLGFTNDRAGRQAWMVGTGAVAGDRIRLSGLVRPLCGVFGRSFDPLTVRREPWGELTLRLDCGGGTASYASTVQGFGRGLQALEPLTRLQHSVCESE